MPIQTFGWNPSSSSPVSSIHLEELCASLAVNQTAMTLGFSNRPSNPLVWLCGLSFVTVIGLCAVVGIVVMRCLKKSVFNRFITFFVSVGVGSLSGSAVFHLLPQAFGLVDEFNPNASHDYLKKSFAAIIGIYLFFFSDKAIKFVLETRKRTKRNNDTTTTHLSARLVENGGNSKEGTNIGTASEGFAMVPRLTPEACDAEQSINRQAHSICVHDHDLDYKQGDSVIATVAWMIIFGDGLHNFIDGISIGAAFSESILSGVSVSVAVLCEEFPHELGDVAILVSAGMSMKQALVYNLLSALSCYIGFAIGVLAGNIDGTFSTYTFGFAGGMFLYISLACMMPEMKNAMEKALNVSLKKGLEVVLLQASGIICGISIMFLMARFGSSIQF